MRRTDRHGAGTHAAHHDDEKELTGCRDDRKQDDSANPPGQPGEQRTPGCQPCPTASVFGLNEGVAIAQP